MTNTRQYPELYHHGIEGMRWGVRRYQNPDGTLTPAGKIRYAKDKVLDATGNVLAKENTALNKATGTSGKLRKAYFDMQRAGIKYREGKYRLDSKDPDLYKMQRNLINKSKRYAEQYIKDYGKKPISYLQNKNALKGAAVGAIAASLLPVVGVWMTVPAGYYVGSKVGKKHKK